MYLICGVYKTSADKQGSADATTKEIRIVGATRDPDVIALLDRIKYIWLAGP